MEQVTIHAKTYVTDGYGETTVSGYNPTPAMTLTAAVAPNNDSTVVAVGRVDIPVRFDVYIPNVEPQGIDPAAHIAVIRGAAYEIDGRSDEWAFMSGRYAGDHFTVTQPFTHPALPESSSSSSSST